MDYVVIKGVRPYDGRWPLDLESRELNTHEWGWIKRFAGYLPTDLADDSKFGDPELITVLAVIALRREGKIAIPQVRQAFDRLADAPFGDAIVLETDRDPDEEVDAGPPASSSTSNGDGSGPSSPASSETSVPPPNSSGTPGSDTSPSDQPTLVT